MDVAIRDAMVPEAGTPDFFRGVKSLGVRAIEVEVGRDLSTKHLRKPDGAPYSLTTFDEVVQGLDESTALFEARRCMSCGNCFECDNCYGVCPDNAITKLGPGKGFSIDLDYCKGCGLCAAECPCGAIGMTPEEDGAGG